MSVFVLQVAEVTFNYWYKLSEDLYNKDSTQLNEVYKPFIQRLIVALCQHCQMDPDHVSSEVLKGDKIEICMNEKMLMMEIDETREIVNFMMYNGFNGSRLQHLFNLYHKMTIVNTYLSVFLSSYLL